MKRLFAFAPGLLLAAMTAVSVTADESLNYSISDDVYIEPVSMLGDAPTPGQKVDTCDCDVKGSKGGKGGCSCYLFGPDEAYSLYSGDNSLGISVGGWTQFGYTNRDSYADLFNQNSDKLNLHQQWFWAERVADGSCGWDWGFRADILYGIDANNTQAFGNDPGNWDYLNGFDHGSYGWAIPQLYAELAKGDLSVKLGHFYTLIGYEVVTAPDNFFFSHAFTMNNSEPFTHTGAIATYNYTDDLTLYGGWTLGWDTGFDQFNGGSSWLGGVGYALSDDVSLTYMSTYGDFGFLGNGRNDSYSHSVVVDFALTDNLNYVFQSDMIKADVYDTVGINQYLFYTLNDCAAVGTRVEWWKNDGVSYNAATFGLNYRPHANLVFRPEIKHEWVPGLDLDQTIFGIDMIVTY
ncbi:MAG: porin [Planctomycetales bacterium]|nr:porin [Planctomycetales bacterium]